MGFFSNLFDHFKSEDFHMSSRMKVKTVQKDFKENFGLTLRVYKGKQFADPDSTINQLDKKTSADIKTNEEDITIRASNTIAEFEDKIKKTYGMTVQVADEFDRYLIQNHYTLGQASRREPLIDHLKKQNYDGIEDFLKKNNCKTLKEYYDKN